MIAHFRSIYMYTYVLKISTDENCFYGEQNVNTKIQQKMYWNYFGGS